MADLTDAEIAELRMVLAEATADYGGHPEDCRALQLMAAELFPRLLAEVERRRQTMRGVAELARSAEFSGDKDRAMAACFEIERRLY